MNYTTGPPGSLSSFPIKIFFRIAQAEPTADMDDEREPHHRYPAFSDGCVYLLKGCHKMTIYEDQERTDFHSDMYENETTS